MQTSSILVLALTAVLLCPVSSMPDTALINIPNFNWLCNGTKVVSVVRYHSVNYAYRLAGRNGVWEWINYPEFNDRFELKTAQYVKFSYSITVTTYPLATHFLTRLLINGKVQDKFIVVTSNQYERTNWSEHYVWLEIGLVTVQVQYLMACEVQIQRPGDWVKPYF